MKKNCSNCRMFLAFDGECPDYRPDSIIIENYNGKNYYYCELYEEDPKELQGEIGDGA